MLFTRFATFLATSIAAANAVSIRYCSNENTGTGFNTGDYVYNTLGYCSTKCQNGSYAYAIVQGHGCWCSNDKPSNIQSPAGCSQQCPGYPAQYCGNTEQGLFGYVEVQPSGSAPCTNNATSLISSSPTTTANSSSPVTGTPGAATTTQSSTLSATPAAYTGAADKVFAWGVGNVVFGLVLGGAVAFGI
ncbi:hypothetical protein M409DRAFT_19685 [Zasmidium cellare ATCC 36951]|uniref:WSC domain-containing protein n=1 Tax=Zasmidium cellare ATCC 36951 TaxID=1080233 RepID=A0A6A6CV62_ZASCE|nr:uncharacterized protein M409DRAFT_19685 [Zasmidium cellare ATCC 36951]KAF2170078.1 hypothetical protein M409DRAFT_19685 [Zasmidium cellare ATCC 36951]